MADANVCARWVYAIGLVLTAINPGSTHAETLPLDTPIVKQIAPGKFIELGLPQTTAPLRIFVDERGVDVDVSLVLGERELTSFDEIYRWGTHLIAVAAATSPAATLRISATRLGSPPGQISIRVEHVDMDSPADKQRLKADLLETEITQKEGDPKLSREPATVSAADVLLKARQSIGLSVDTERAVFLLNSILAVQARRPQAIELLTSNLSLWRELNDHRGEATALNDIGMHHFRLGDSRLAGPPLQQALQVLRAQQEPLLAAVIQNNLCLVNGMRGDMRTAGECFDNALALSLKSGDLVRIANAYNNLGGVYSQSGETFRASAAFEKSIAIRERIDERAGKGNGYPYMNLALERQAQGRYAKALMLLDKAAIAYRADNDANGAAIAMRSRGQLYSMLGDYDRAIALFSDTLVVQRHGARRDELVTTLANLAEAELKRGKRDAALAHVREGIDLVKIDNDPRRVAETLLRAARMYISIDDANTASELVDEARKLAESVRSESLVAASDLESARAETKAGRFEIAAAQADRAARWYSTAAWLLSQADALSLAAVAKGRLGKFAAAAADFAEGLKLIERARSYVFDPQLRATFLATQSALYRGQVAMLMQRAIAGTDKKLAAQAFAASERFRARSLIDRLESSSLRTAEEDGPTDHRNDLLSRLSSLALARSKLGDDPKFDERRAEIERKLGEAEDALRLFDARRSTKAGVKNLAGTAPSSELDAVQRALPASTQLVDYLVTDEATWVWIVSKDQFRFHRLAKRANIDQQVDATLDALGLPNRARTSSQPWNTVLQKTCEAIWQPFSAEIDSRRIVVVADGSLTRLPFAAVRCVGVDGSEYLVERHEISMLPSASLLTLPEPARSRPDASGEHALVIVDPIYSKDDPRLSDRLAESQSTSGPQPQSRSVLDGVLPRLPGGQAEAHTIANLIGEENTVVLQGSDAAMTKLESMRLGDYGIIHFATHGLADFNGIAGSGLVLSQFDRSGKSVEGFLSMRQIVEWHLNADLVMLGACDSGNGLLIDGEGLSGVAYAFLSAGAKTVVATLWPVDDRSTSKLTSAFYAAFVGNKFDTATALRVAQLEMLKSPAFNRPSQWAGAIAISVRSPDH
ncbi:MAG: CHAT domain-containing protein [Dokdonella sp.]